MVIARYGAGVWMYTAYAFYRELPLGFREPTGCSLICSASARTRPFIQAAPDKTPRILPKRWGRCRSLFRVRYLEQCEIRFGPAGAMRLASGLA